MDWRAIRGRPAHSPWRVQFATGRGSSGRSIGDVCAGVRGVTDLEWQIPGIEVNSVRFAVTIELSARAYLPGLQVRLVSGVSLKF
jgi:hypothetical protein